MLATSISALSRRDMDRSAHGVRKSTVSSPASNLRITSRALSSGVAAAHLPARPHGREEAPTRGGDHRSRALPSPGEATPVNVTHATPRVRWSGTVCGRLREPGPMSPARVAEKLANGRRRPVFCDLLANLHLHLEDEVDLDRAVQIRRTSAAAVMSLADAIEQALSPLGARAHSTSFVPPTHWRPLCGRSPTRRQGLTDAYAGEPTVPPEWNLDSTSALTRPLTATCVGLLADSTARNHNVTT